MIDIILILLLAVILGGAAGYVWKAKKSGKKCIGCPENASCSGQCGGCACSCDKDK